MSVTGKLDNMSDWVEFVDRNGVTRVFKRDRCERHSEFEQCVMVADDRGIKIPIFTRETYDEIMGVKR